MYESKEVLILGEVLHKSVAHVQACPRAQGVRLTAQGWTSRRAGWLGTQCSTFVGGGSAESKGGREMVEEQVRFPVTDTADPLTGRESVGLKMCSN